MVYKPITGGPRVSAPSGGAERSASVLELERELAQVESLLERNRLEQERAVSDAAAWETIAGQGAPRPRNTIHGGPMPAAQAVPMPVPVAVPVPAPVRAPSPALVPMPHLQHGMMSGALHDVPYSSTRRMSASSADLLPADPAPPAQRRFSHPPAASEGSGSRTSAASSAVSHHQYQNMLKAAQRSQNLVTEQAQRLAEVQDRLRALEGHTAQAAPSGPATPKGEREEMLPRSAVEAMLHQVRVEVREEMGSKDQQRQAVQPAPRDELVASLTEQLRGMSRDMAHLKASVSAEQHAHNDTLDLDLQGGDELFHQRKQMLGEIVELERDMMSQLRGLLARKQEPQPRLEVQEGPRHGPEAPDRAAVQQVPRQRQAPGCRDDAVFEDCGGCCTACPRCCRPPSPRVVHAVVPRAVEHRHAVAKRLSPPRVHGGGHAVVPPGVPLAPSRRARITTPSDERRPSLSPERVAAPDFFRPQVSPEPSVPQVVHQPRNAQHAVRAQSAQSPQAMLNTLDAEGTTPLLRACHDGNEPGVRQLVHRGADPEVADGDGWTPLHVAAQKGFVGCVKALLDSGCNVNSRDCDGSTPLMVAALEAHPEVLRMLLVMGSRVETRDDDGTTALMVAAQASSERCVDLLLRNGADPLVRDAAGRTALAFAQASNASRQCIKALVRAEKLAAADVHPHDNLLHVGSASSRTSPNPTSVSGSRLDMDRMSPPPRAPHQNLSFVY